MFVLCYSIFMFPKNGRFCCVRFSFLTTRRLKNDLFCLQWDVKTSGITTAPTDPAMQGAREGLRALVPTPSPSQNHGSCRMWIAVHMSAAQFTYLLEKYYECSDVWLTSLWGGVMITFCSHCGGGEGRIGSFATVLTRNKPVEVKSAGVGTQTLEIQY